MRTLLSIASRRVLSGVAAFAALALAAGSASGVSVVSAAADQTVQVELGSAPVGGCDQSPDFDDTSCSDTKMRSGAIPTALPVRGATHSRVTTATGTDSVTASGSAEVSVREPFPEDLEHDPDRVLEASLEASASIADSEPESFHTSASASVSNEGYVELALPSILPEEELFFELNLNKNSREGYTTLYDGLLRVEDVTTGTTIASFDESSTVAPRHRIDLASHAGHEIRISHRADLAIAGDAGFAEGRSSFRSFRTYFSGHFFLNRTVVPEPGTAGLLLAGLGALALGGSARRDARR